MRLLTLIHGDDVGPELLADVAEADGHELVAWDMERDGPPPRDADAVVVLGGHQNVGEEGRYPWLEHEYAALRDWVQDGVPVLGVCLGAQALAHAAGARVEPLGRQLTGFYATTLTDAGVADPVLGALPPAFEAFNGNAYAFDVPSDGVTLATGPCVQAFRVGGRAWGVQFHPEVKGPTVLPWFEGAARDDVARQLEEKLPDWLPLGRRLFRAFFAQARS